MKNVIRQQFEGIRLATIKRYLPGLVILIGAGLSVLLLGSWHLVPAVSLKPTPVPTTAAVHSRPFSLTAWTNDKQFQVALNASPNQYGTNVFTVIVKDKQGTLVPANTLHVTLLLTNLDMDMGIEQIGLQIDSNGNLSAVGDLSMDGNWQARIIVHTADTTSHEAIIAFFTPA